MTRQLPNFVTQEPAPASRSTARPRNETRKAVFIKTESYGTASKNAEELDTRVFDVSLHKDREALIRFISWCATNGKPIKITPFDITGIPA